MRPLGPSPLPVRPLRLRPKTATAGGRAHVTPDTGPHQLAAVTPTGAARAGPAPCSRRPRHEATKGHRRVPVRIPSPALIIV